MHTKILSGMRKKFIIVLLASSGMYWDLIFIMEGQNIPTQASKVQKPSIWRHPENEMPPPPFTLEGATKNCSMSETLNIKSRACKEEKKDQNERLETRHTLVTIGSRRDTDETRKTICM